jgi:hypothetical protein
MNEERLSRLEQRIRELEDKADITRLIYRYAECIRFRDSQGCRALLCDDAFFELRHIDPVDCRRDSLVRRMDGADEMVLSRDDEAGANTVMWPMIHAPMVTVEGDSATAICLSETAMWPFGRASIGEYRDNLVRTSEGWKFASRRFCLFGDSSGRLAAELRAHHQSIKS